MTKGIRARGASVIVSVKTVCPASFRTVAAITSVFVALGFANATPVWDPFWLSYIRTNRLSLGPMNETIASEGACPAGCQRNTAKPESLDEVGESGVSTAHPC